ncbi:putative chorismate mutase [Helianthus debilis subsp. tardiflorus]
MHFFNNEIWDMYFKYLVPRLDENGNDGPCGLGAKCDYQGH